MKIKICGLKYRANLKEIAILKPDMLGFIFDDKSPRCMTGTLIPKDLLSMSDDIVKVGVFMNQPIEYVLRQADRFGLDAIQFQGNESPHDMHMAKSKDLMTIKAIKPELANSRKTLASFESVVDYFLFETPSTQHSGTGESFEWSELAGYESSQPFILSGGLGLGNWKGALDLKPKPAILDVNSRFESTPGLKDLEKVREFLAQVRDGFQG